MPPQQDRGESRKGKSEKNLMGRDKDRLTCEEKLQVKQNGEFIPYLPLPGRCPATSWEAGLNPCNGCMGRQII